MDVRAMARCHASHNLLHFWPTFGLHILAWRVAKRPRRTRAVLPVRASPHAGGPRSRTRGDAKTKS
eukprot:6209023-Pyramimonas_sp.AAC.1